MTDEELLLTIKMYRNNDIVIDTIIDDMVTLTAKIAIILIKYINKIAVDDEDKTKMINTVCDRLNNNSPLVTDIVCGPLGQPGWAGRDYNSFYLFHQNNSYGRYDVDEDVSEWVVVEAASGEYAEEKMEELTKNQSSSCPCCGPRWSLYDPELIEDFATIEEYCQDLANKYGDNSENEPSVVLHFSDGKKKYFNYNKGE